MTCAVSTQGSIADDSAEDMTKVGLVDAHAYSLIAAIEVNISMIKKERLVQIRNPWGFREWSGDWSDTSDKWTEFPDAIKNIETAINARQDTLERLQKYEKGPKYEFVRDKNDGCFWMTFSDYMHFFYITSICYFEASWHNNWVMDIQSRHLKLSSAGTDTNFGVFKFSNPVDIDDDCILSIS
jgi:hypothetical protein